MNNNKFKFRLQRVLDFREDKERQSQKKLFLASNMLKTAREELAGLEEELQRVKNLQKKEADAFNLESALQCSRYMEYLAELIRVKKELIRERSGIVEEKRRQVREAAKEKDILITLKEKKYDAYIKDSMHEEQKRLDEFALVSRDRRLRD